MYKDKFNSLYTSVMDFVLDEKVEIEFETLTDEIHHYHNIVDDYNEIVFNLNNIKSVLDLDDPLHTDINESILTLNMTFDKYKEKSSIVRAYLDELSKLGPKVLFAERLYKYERMFLSNPLIKIDPEEIQTLVNHAKEYIKNRSSFSYFVNDPFDLYDGLNYAVPIKRTFDKSEDFLVSVFNYTQHLFQRHNQEFADELSSMQALENIIKEKLYEYNYEFNVAQKDIISSDITPEEFYAAVLTLEEKLKGLSDSLVELGVYRFTEHTRVFDVLYKQITNFVDNYKDNNLAVSFVNNREFDKKIEQLGEYIKLIETGTIQVDVHYVITDTTIKQIVEDIVRLAEATKRKIRYTQEYHFSGKPTELEFEFYQVGLFLASIKEYYYELVTKNTNRTHKLTVDDFGDASIVDVREEYKARLGDYRRFIAQNVDHMNDFEFKEYYDDIVKIQNRLKAVASTFFRYSLSTSQATYVNSIEQQHADFIAELKTDLENLVKNRRDAILEVTDPNKEKAYKTVMDIEDILEKINQMIEVSESSPFFWLTDYITKQIKVPFMSFFDDLTELYNKEDYVALFKLYDDFYKDNILNFNLVHAMIKFSDSTKGIFERIAKLDEMYIDELAFDVPKEEDSELLTFLNDLFDDDTYKVVRNEVFSEIDAMYEFIISTKPNDKAYLTNEKNLKKMFFDAQIMKISFYKWYHDILIAEQIYKTYDIGLMEGNELFQEKKHIIEKFDHKDKINRLVETQNMALASTEKMIKEYVADNNFYASTDFDTIQKVDQYNENFRKDYDEYLDVIKVFGKLEKFISVDNNMVALREQHTNQWVDMISVNDISEPQKISYDGEMKFGGNIPFSVELKAEVETSGNEIDSTFEWFIEDQIIEGPEAFHTYYDEGEHLIRCKITYPSGETATKVIKLELGGPQNTLLVKSETLEYAPLDDFVHEVKFTYDHPDTGKRVTIPISVSGGDNILQLIKDGSISFNHNSSDYLTPEKVGLIILGFEGETFAGHPYDYKHIFNNGEDWTYPTVHEFLFDFHVSVPVANTATIDITQSKFTKFMARIPHTVPSIFEIDRASEYYSIGTDTKIATGDKLILKNQFDRYAIIEIKDMQVFEERQNGEKYHYEIEIDYFVNISLEDHNRDDFSPKRTDLDVPVLVFKQSVREMFKSLIDRLEVINNARKQIAEGVDTEQEAMLQTEIARMEDINKRFYLFEELARVNAKHQSLQMLLERIEHDNKVDFDLPLDEVEKQINFYKSNIDKTQTFEQYMKSVDAYNFKQNIVDLKVLIDLYREQEIVMNLLIETYSCGKYDDIGYYANKLSDITLFNTDGFIDESLEYGPALVKLVLKLRELLFKIKLTINFPIMAEGRYVIMSEAYERWKKNLSTQEWTEEEEQDLYLLNKKLELKYGYETDKVENGNTYKDFITDLVYLEKDLFGKGLSNDDVTGISKYIQSVEEKAIGEYDDFFMLPFWIDYIEKNV